MDEKFAAIEKEVMDVIDLYNEAGRPSGFYEIFKFLFNSASELIEIVEASSEVLKDAKKETVIEAVKFIYGKIDPDLPWIPEPFETKIEDWVINHVISSFIDWVVSKYNDKGIFSHSE